MSQLTFFNYVTGITLGSLTANFALSESIGLAEGLSSIVLWTGLTLLVGYLSFKTPKAKLIFNGEPSIVIKKGHIQKASLKSSRLNLDDLLMLLRAKNIFSIAEIEYAIFEPNGKLSILQKAQNLPITKKDLNITHQTFLYIPTQVIAQGLVISRNLSEVGLTEQWLRQELQKQDIINPCEVFYAEVQSDGTLYVDKYS